MQHDMPAQLSKSRFLAGLQCLKRLYLDCFQRELADPVQTGRQAIFDAGHAVGEMARLRFPGGALVAEPYFEHWKAEETTRALLRDWSVPTLYEPAFSFEGIRTRIDVLQRTAGRAFDLIEVKSTASAKDEHIPDVAIQIYVVEGCGVPVGRAYLMHLNTTYVYPGGAYDPNQLFSLRDVTEEVRAYAEEEMPEELSLMWEALEQAEVPDIETGRQCTRPYFCPFFGHCHKDEPEHPIRELPNLTPRGYERLRAEGISDVASIPPELQGLSWLQRRVRDCVVKQEPFFGPDLPDLLEQIEPPVSFLDFEALNSAVPIYAGTRPFQTVPFQWSLHVREPSGSLRHSSFLANGREDPRESLVTSLLGSVPKEGCIVTYSNYERTVLRGLAQALPQYEDSLLALCERIVDLHRMVRAGYYHPDMHGSFSIKSVLPALVPSLTYYDLDIPEGRAAVAAYVRSIDPNTPDAEGASIRRALLDYCKRDTEAMVRVYEALLAEASG